MSAASYPPTRPPAGQTRPPSPRPPSSSPAAYHPAAHGPESSCPTDCYGPSLLLPPTLTLPAATLGPLSAESSVTPCVNPGARRRPPPAPHLHLQPRLDTLSPSPRRTLTRPCLPLAASSAAKLGGERPSGEAWSGGQHLQRGRGHVAPAASAA